MSKNPVKPLGELILQGIGVSPGVATGRAVVFTQEGTAVPERTIHAKEVPSEIVRFEEALAKTRHQISEIRKKTRTLIGEEHAGIFDAHLLLVDDPCFMEEVFRGLREDLCNVEAVLSATAGRFIEMFSRVEDDYLRERAGDVRDVVRRIVDNLAGERIDRMSRLTSPCIAVAHDFTPSDTAGLNRDMVLALLSDSGTATSHAAIMARALEVPAVVGLHDVSARINSGDTILVDGGKGEVIIRPSPKRMRAYAQRAETRKTFLCGLESRRNEPSETADRYGVPVAANIELPAELQGIRRCGAQGIGLFRTEFLFFNESSPPDEEMQTRVYSEAADRCNPHNTVIRTLDLGGDKFPSSVPAPPESNPFLGWRAIRFCLANPSLFKTQLRAVLRAAAGRNISLMYPMISCLSEVQEANRILEECRQELLKEGLPCAENLPVGAMIEIPSAALTADLIAPHVAFFSIGTNDLIQYTLAVDRDNENVAHLYLPAHISVLKLIHQTVVAGHAHCIPVAVCGQMAATPELVPLLIGLGVDELSVSPPSVPLIKDLIRRIRYADCRILAGQALSSGGCGEVLFQCREFLRKTSPDLLELIG